MQDCLFCKIGRHELDNDFVYEDDDVFVIHDIHPKAKVHVLAIPKQHLVNFNDVSNDNREIIGKLGVAIAKVTKDLGIAESGYKVVTNNGKHGGQAVPHLHMHVLGGESVKGLT